MARSYRLTLADRIRFIYIPNAAPQIFAGARVSLAIAAVVMVVTEMIGSPGGIGYFILDSQRTFKILNMWSGIVMLGVLGLPPQFRIPAGRGPGPRLAPQEERLGA